MSDSDELVGFYAISVALEKYSNIPNYEEIFPHMSIYEVFPVLELQWLATAKVHQGNGIGKQLVGRVIDDFAQIALLCGVSFLTLRAATPKAFSFYEGLRFSPYEADGVTRMLLDAESAISMLELKKMLANPD